MMVVGFLAGRAEVGSAMSYLKALYAIKCLYAPCEVVLFGNAITNNLFTHCDFIDASLDINEFDGNPSSAHTHTQITTINKYHCDYLIVADAKSTSLRFALKTNAKCIICALKFISLFSTRTRTIPLYAKKRYLSMAAWDIWLHFARAINPRIYDKHIQEIDFGHIRLSIDPRACEVVQLFLSQHLQTNSYKRIMVNPFNINNPYTLPLHGYFMMIRALCALPHCCVIVATYPQVHAHFMQYLGQIPESIPHNLYIFENNANLQNLIALLYAMDCLISPSTGSTHIAHNIGIPTIGLYAKYDIGRWGYEYMDYVLLESKQDDLTLESCEEIIAQVVSKVWAIMGIQES